MVSGLVSRRSTSHSCEIVAQNVTKCGYNRRGDINCLRGGFHLNLNEIGRGFKKR